MCSFLCCSLLICQMFNENISVPQVQTSLQSQPPYNPSSLPDTSQQYGYYSGVPAADGKPSHMNGSTSNHNSQSDPLVDYGQDLIQPSNLVDQLGRLQLNQEPVKSSFSAFGPPAPSGMPVSSSGLPFKSVAEAPTFTPSSSGVPVLPTNNSGGYSQTQAPQTSSMGDNFQTGFLPMGVIPPQPRSTMVPHVSSPPMMAAQPSPPTMPLGTVDPSMTPSQVGQQQAMPFRFEQPMMTPQPRQPMMPPQAGQPTMAPQFRSPMASPAQPASSGQPMGMMPPQVAQPTGMMPSQQGQPVGMMPPQQGQPMGVMPPHPGQPMRMMPHQPVQPMGMMPPQPVQPMRMMPPQPVQPMGMMPPQPVQPMGMMPPQPVQPMGMVPSQPNSSPMMPPGMAQGGPRTPSSRVMADNMPSAVEVIECDRTQRGGVVYKTSQMDVVPPLVTTDYICRDEGNCNPRFIRSSLYRVPVTADLMKQIGLPFIISCQPFADLNLEDDSVMLSDMGPQGPVRCIRCKAYVSPYFTFIDGGRRFQCCLCGACTDVPPDYFAHLDHMGRRIDAFQRPELCRGSYELMATKEYCKNDELPLPPAFIFLLDVSQTSIRSGLVNLFCSRFITEILPNLPKEEHDSTSGANSPVSIGFITYDQHLHFYNLVRSTPASSNGSPQSSVCLSKPQMNVVADTSEVFVPAIEGFLVPADTRIVTNLLSTIPTHFTEGPQTVSTSPDPILGPAIQAGLEVLKVANRCGKLFILHSCLPTADAPGRLKHREDRHAVGTDKEKAQLAPATDFYTTLGKQCVEAGCSVDVFLFPNSYVDVATISEVPCLTAGNLYKYSCFQADSQGEQFISDLRTAVSQPKAFNAVMRIRTSTGTRPFEYLGNAHLPNTTDVELAALDSHQSVCCEVRHDDSLTENDLVFIQAAVLYTSIGGHRRLRIHNLALTTSNSAADVFRLADLDCFMNWLCKIALQHAIVKTPTQLLTDMTSRVSHALAGYRRLCTGGQHGSASPGELVLPETIKLLPLYVQCLMKSDAIRSAKNSTIDDRSFVMFLLNGMGPKDSNRLLYPRVIPLHTIDPSRDDDLPTAIRCSYERLEPNGAYFVENGVYAFIWCGLKIDPVWIQNVFGVTDIHNLEPEKTTLKVHDNPLSKCICNLVYRELSSFNLHPKLRIIRQGELAEAWIKRFMYEDRDDCGNASYVEYLCHIHKEVRALLG